jgi:hypothetical protein
MSRLHAAFTALVVAQAAHSIEEYVGRLWESFPPATFVTSLVSSDHERGFVILNVAIAVFGVWCVLWPVRRGWRSATGIVWGWVIVEAMNGIGHPTWSVLQRGYTPGVITAPFLLVLAVYLASQLRVQRRTAAAIGTT